MRTQNVKNIHTHTISAVQLDMEGPDHEADMQQGTYRLVVSKSARVDELVFCTLRKILPLALLEDLGR